MKNLVLVTTFVLLGCEQLVRPQEQPIKELESNTYSTTCSGMAETMGTCHEKAKRTCRASYAIIKQNQDSSGVHRELTFQCKK